MLLKNCGNRMDITSRLIPSPSLLTKAGWAPSLRARTMAGGEIALDDNAHGHDSGLDEKEPAMETSSPPGSPAVDENAAAALAEAEGLAAQNDGLTSQLMLAIADSDVGSTTCRDESSDPAVEAYFEANEAKSDGSLDEHKERTSKSLGAPPAASTHIGAEDDNINMAVGSPSIAAVVSPLRVDSAACSASSPGHHDNDTRGRGDMMPNTTVPTLVDNVVSDESDDGGDDNINGNGARRGSLELGAASTGGDPLPRPPEQGSNADQSASAQESMVGSATSGFPTHPNNTSNGADEPGTPLIQGPSAPLSPGSGDSHTSKSSSLLDMLLGEAKAAADTSVILSDAGESKCASTAPVINLTFGGRTQTSDDETTAAWEGALSKATSTTSDGPATPTTASGDGKNDVVAKGSEISFYTSKDGPGSRSPGGSVGDDHQRVIKTTISSGSGTSSQAEIEATRTTPSARVARPGEHAGRSRSPRKARSPIPVSPNSNLYNVNAGSGYDKKRLSERLRQRLAKRNQMHAASSSPTKGSTENGNIDNDNDSSSNNASIPESPAGSYSPTSRSQNARSLQTRLQVASRQKRRSKTRAKSSVSNENGEDVGNSGILSRYSRSSEGDASRIGKIYPESVTFSDGEEESVTYRGSPGPHLRVDTALPTRRSVYRKCVSEVGASLSLSARAARSKLSKHHHSHHHGIGILQADGIVYDDALLLRLARQARYGRLRGEVNAATEDGGTAVGTAGGGRRYNDVKIHVYDLLTKDALVDIPYFNCNFPIGQCFKVVNDGCHVLGTGAYHVGVEVNGVEYAFGANNIIGMSGIFTCVPKESPGYEYRETLDFGKLHTTKRTWIRIPKSGTGVSFKAISAALGGSADSDEKNLGSKSAPATFTPQNKASSSSKEMRDLYSFREIESFADGHTIIHSMAREYMGTDYDLLRKNCCTFARDVCTRLGVSASDIPTWFHNAAQAGADAEDAITSVEYSVRNMLDCAEGVDPLDLECYNHGFEVIPEGNKGGMKVVESPAMSAASRERRPICGDGDVGMPVPDETASWTY